MINMSVIKAFLVSPLKWLRVTVAVIFFIGIAYAFLHHIPAWNVPNMTGGGEGMEDSFSLARWQFVPSVLGTLSGAAVSAVILGVLLLLTLLFGRVYCSFICPLGILQDIVFRIRRWLAPKRFLKFSRPVPWVRYGVLALLAACCVTGLAGLSLNWLDPYSIFGRIMYVLAWPAAIWSNNLLAADSSSADLVQMDYFPAAFPVLLASAGMLGLVAVMSAWKGRLYCNTVCPVGTLLGLLSRISLFRLGFDPASCQKCGKCVKSCKAQCLNLKEYKIDFSRCVACYDCVRSCSEGGIRYRWFTRARQLIPAQKKEGSPGSRSLFFRRGSLHCREFPPPVPGGYCGRAGHGRPFRMPGRCRPEAGPHPVRSSSRSRFPGTFSGYLHWLPDVRCQLPYPCASAFIPAAWPEGIHETPDGFCHQILPL